MTEIKFRAWCLEKEVMLMRSTVSRSFVDTKHALSDKAKEENYILMQYTGRKDKNGAEIYQGDVAKAEGVHARGDGQWDDVLFNIKWDDEYSCFIAKEIDCLDWYFLFDYDLTVIGNIYENPELLN